MHRIRLREPWAASLNAELDAIVYARKFHKPTGVEQLAIGLVVSLLPQDIAGTTSSVALLVNGREILARRPEHHSENAMYFQLTDLLAFNFLELRISIANPTTLPNGMRFDATSIPKFGSFVIETVELQIE
jgi:hypothetical protein